MNAELITALRELAREKGIPFDTILAGYARDRWFGIARGEDLKAAIERAAAAWLPGLDMDAFWSRWRVD